MNMTDKKLTQREEVLEYIKRYGSIDFLSAIYDLGISQLAARIVELQYDGVLIEKKKIKRRARNGKEFGCMSYSLAQEKG
jgi:hypothetical protein